MTLDFEEDPLDSKEDYNAFEERQIDLDEFEDRVEGIDEPLDDYLGFTPAVDVFEEREEEL